MKAFFRAAALFAVWLTSSGCNVIFGFDEGTARREATILCNKTADCPVSQTCAAGKCMRGATGSGGSGAANDGDAGDDSDASGSGQGGGSGGSDTAVPCELGQTRNCSEAGLLGNCAPGNEVCNEDGTWGECSIPPARKDLCEPGDDSNCDGQVNGGCACMVGSVKSCDEVGLYGKCANGTVVCGDSGRWGGCSITPSASDTCAPRNDDNCNGIPNEGCACVAGASRPCYEDVGAVHGKCANGTEVCDDKGKWSACSIAPSPADTCDVFNDDNCNGEINEGCQCINLYPSDCGVCGLKACVDGKAGTYGPCVDHPKSTFYLDSDGDGFGNAVVKMDACQAPQHYVADGSDCCDSNPLQH
jgi:hypothetical protein